MNLLTQVNSKKEVDSFIKLGIKHLILSPSSLARRGKLSFGKTVELIDYGFSQGIEFYIQADILIPERKFKAYTDLILKFPLKKIKAIRVQDLGLAYFLTKEKNINIHFICETGFHNLQSILTLKAEIGEHLKRIILSLEVPGEELKKWLPKIKIDTEILILGPLPIFYSSRKILSAYYKDNQENNSLLISSKEIKTNKQIEIFENQHGSFLYFYKDVCLFKHTKALQEKGLNFVRIDRYENDDITIFSDLVKKQFNYLSFSFSDIQSIWKKDLFNAFFNKNQTDARFKVLKNKTQERQKDYPLAVVLEANKGGNIIFLAKKDLKTGMKVKLITPIGKEKEFVLDSMLNSNLADVDLIKEGHIFITPFRKGVTSKSYLYLQH